MLTSVTGDISYGFTIDFGARLACCHEGERAAIERAFVEAHIRQAVAAERRAAAVERIAKAHEDYNALVRSWRAADDEADKWKQGGE